VTAGLFAGIGGIEVGLERAGHRTGLLCEIDPAAQAVLRSRFAGIGALHSDVKELASLPKSVELLTAGFPCQDLSQAGKTAGIAGARSGLVGEVFRLLASRRVPWVLIENVPFMLRLGKGTALDVIIDALEGLGYDWAYRVIDSRAFGLPQRRERVYILASLCGDPRDVLLASDAGAPEPTTWRLGRSFGFYWTEGIRGLGAAVGAIPTLKGGSTIGIPSSPAILLSDGRVITPDLRDAERLQGFDPDWTKPAEEIVRASFRWKLVGNAVSVPVAEWIGNQLIEPGQYDDSLDEVLTRPAPWPRAAWSIGGKRHVSVVSSWPVRGRSTDIEAFLRHPGKALSARATAGFLERARSGSLRFPSGFLEALDRHLARVSGRGRPAKIAG
jgi:DNA (cytosine-5)-methyltransferase 1